MYKFLKGITVLCLLWYANYTIAQCPNSYTININRYPECNTASNGRLSLRSNTYYANSTYQWSNGSTGRSTVNLGVGHYKVTITDPSTCTYVDSIYLPPLPSGQGVVFSPNTCLGSLYAYPTGSGDSYTYQWSTGETTPTIAAVNGGVYNVTMTGPSGCPLTGTYNWTSSASPLQVTYTTTPASCNASDGSIDITVTGGVPPYRYTYRQITDNGSSYPIVGNTEDLLNAGAGRYQLAVRDQNNCYQFFDTIEVGGPAIYLQSYRPSCGSTNNGGIDVLVEGMTNPTYLWSTGATTASATNLSVGTYTVTVTDGSCAVVGSATVNNPGNALSAYIVDSLANCQQGSLTAYGYGGAGNGYTYLWSTGETTPTIAAVNGGVYNVTVTDRNGCTAVSTTVVQSGQGQLGLSATVQDATCGNNDGAIDLTISGLYHHLVWEPNISSGEDLTNLSAGRYQVSFYNYNQCLIQRDTFFVGEFFETAHTAASCGLSNGSAAVTTYNMTNPTYQWSNGATTASVNNLAAGTYTVTVTHGTCTLTDVITILDAGQLSANIQANAVCQPDFLVAVPYGGASPYSFVWSTGGTAQNLTSLVTGATYQVTISDANGCTASASYTMPNYPLPSATATTTAASCGNKNGSITLSATGGTPPYQYNWSLGGGNSPTYIGVYPGQYTATVTDNNGCKAVVPIQVGGGIPTGVNARITQPTPSNNDGAIDLTVTNSANPTFLWSNGATTEDLTNLSQGRYTVSITDPTSGCVLVRNYRLHNNAGNCGGQHAVISGYVYDVTASSSCQRGLPLPFRMVRLQPGGQLAFTDSQGKYNFSVATAGTYTVEYVNNSAGTTILCPNNNQHTVVAALGSCYTQKDFHLIQQPFDNLTVRLRDYSNATPGFPYITRVHFCNEGNTVRSGTIEYDYNSSLDFKRIAGLGSTLTLHDIPNHKFYWSFAGLVPNQCRSIDVTFIVPPTTALGTSLVGVTDIFPVVGDAVPSNNTSTEQTVVVGAYDPNDKQVGVYRNGNAWTGGSIYTTDETLDYTIRFQNTGTASANWVIIRDTLDHHLLPHTIRDLQSKHPMDVTVEDGNVLVFTFNNIYLPDSSTDFEASIGFVQFTIDRAPNLPLGTQIPNQAAIYFDHNPPIFTNQPVSVIDRFTSVVDVQTSSGTMKVQPNPFVDNILLRYELPEPSAVDITIYDMLGQCVYQQHLSEQPLGEQQQWIKLGHLPSGAYVVRMNLGEEQLTQQLIKQ